MAEVRTTVYQRTLVRAAEILGGKEKLRAYLRVPARRLEAWLAGERPPVDIFLRAVDVVNPRGASSLLRRSSSLQQASQEIVRESARVMAEAGRIRGAVAPTRTASAAAEFFSRSFALADRREVLEAALEAAIDVTGADMGNVQLASADGLRIVAQRGFDAPFLQYFALVTAETASACGKALRLGQRVVVTDVASDQIFAGTPAAEVMEAAGARAVQSTPLVAASGWIAGMLSTHFTDPGAPSEEALARVDQIARRTAAWLEAATAPGR